MFKDSHITQLTPWSVLEESVGMPPVNYPALVGSGLLCVGVDGAGLQSLPDKLAEYLGSTAAPYHATQADLYVLHEGLISEHLYQDEVAYTGKEIPAGAFCYGMHRNYMPLGYLTQTFAFAGNTFDGAAVMPGAFGWRREWDLHQALLRTAFQLDRRVGIETEIFTPYGGETIYLKLTRRALPGAQGNFRWSVRLPLETRHGLVLFDQPGAVKVGSRTLLATINGESRYAPSEEYAIVYGVAADGATVEMSEQGWTASLDAPLAEEAVACVRLDFRRFAGEDTARAAARRDALEEELAAFSAEDYRQARARHCRDYAQFWATTADIEVVPEDAFELQRRFLLHMSCYLFHCGNDLSFGGTAQFLFFHQNGWAASNFHDHHYIVDGVARANMWQQAEANAHWMRRVMRPSGRAFPWMMTYEGRPTAPAGLDRAPMSDANRAMLAARLYEMAGQGRAALLREVVYPIVKRVADMAVEEWFYTNGDRLLFRAVENDVMNEEPIVNDAATMLIFLSVIRKALAYSEALGVDVERRPAWQRVIAGTTFEVAAGRYVPYLHAAEGAKGSCWLCNSFYIAEAQPFLDDATYARTCDYGQPAVTCNLPWIGFAAASSEIRLGRPDRAEQFFVDTITHRTHGPGYFEECMPVAGIPPFVTAHGSHLTASCEQLVRPDFWQHRVYLDGGLPSKLRAATVRFSNIRARDGLLVSGESTPSRLTIHLHHTGDPVEMELIIKLPCEITPNFQVRRDDQPQAYEFHGETITVHLPLQPDQHTELMIGEADTWR